MINDCTLTLSRHFWTTKDEKCRCVRTRRHILVFTPTHKTPTESSTGFLLGMLHNACSQYFLLFFFSFFAPICPLSSFFYNQTRIMSWNSVMVKRELRVRAGRMRIICRRLTAWVFEKAGFPILSLPLNDGAQESTCSVHPSGREEPGCQRLTTEWGLLTHKPIRSQRSRHKKPGHHLKSAKDNLPRIIPKLTI